MGYRCVAYTPWMAEILRERLRPRVRVVRVRHRPRHLHVRARSGREPATVAVYARQETARRGVELALAALALLKERRPEVRVVLFGSYSPAEAGFDHVDLGVAAPARLAELYRRSTVGRRLLAHHPLARRARDDGLGAAGRRAGRRQRLLGARRLGRGGRAGRARPGVRRRRDRGADRPARARRRRWRGGRGSSSRRATGTVRATSSRGRCARSWSGPATLPQPSPRVAHGSLATLGGRPHDRTGARR